MTKRQEREEAKTHEWDYVRGQRKTLRPNCKLALLVKLMQRPSGASIADLVSATGWKNHSARAAVTLIKKRGYIVTRTLDESWRGVYRIRREWRNLQPDLTHTLRSNKRAAQRSAHLKRSSAPPKS
jgi:hypothetical protein